MMRINNYTPSFGAVYHSTLNANKYCENTKTYEPTEINCLKYDKNNPNDIKALIKLCRLWIGGKEYYKTITDDILRQKGQGIYDNDLDIFILTTQKDDFEKLDEKQICGLSEVERLTESRNIVDYIEINPQYTHSKKSQWLGLGRALIDNIKKLDKEFVLEADDDVIEFYEKNGLEKILPNEKMYEELSREECITEPLNLLYWSPEFEEETKN